MKQANVPRPMCPRYIYVCKKGLGVLQSVWAKQPGPSGTWDVPRNSRPKTAPPTCPVRPAESFTRRYTATPHANGYVTRPATHRSSGKHAESWPAIDRQRIDHPGSGAKCAKSRGEGAGSRKFADARRSRFGTVSGRSQEGRQ